MVEDGMTGGGAVCNPGVAVPTPDTEAKMISAVAARLVEMVGRRSRGSRRPGRLATAEEVAGWARSGERKRRGCGDGLWLEAHGARASWLLRYERGGRARQMGLGPYPAITLEMARERAAAAHALLALGIDPIDARRAAGGRP